MSKRKAVGGYEDSSDGPEDDSATVMRPPKSANLAPFAPPRLTAASKPHTSTFALPVNARPIRESVPNAPNPALVPALRSSLVEPGLQSQREVARLKDQLPLAGIVSDPELESEYVAPLSPSINIRVTTSAAPQMPRPGIGHPVAPSGPALARSALSLERQVNDLATRLGKLEELINQQHEQLDEKLTRLTEAVSHWPLGNAGTALGMAPGRSLSVGSVGSETKPYLSNPMPTPDLIAIVSKVVSDTRNRVGKKKGGIEDNSLKEHARNTFYRMLGISAAKAIHPYFEDEHGEPDTLPAHFVDHETNYCQPYPHWKVSLAKQVVWIPTYMLRFRTTIPNDQSELSNILRNLTDEQIVILLNDGPFKSAQTAWRDMNKTNEELEIMRTNARRYRRADKKVITRGRYIQHIPSLQGPEWEYLSHHGYMSQDESDDEGVVVTKRPDFRPQWVTNLYEAIYMAELEKLPPGSQPPAPRKIEVVPRPLPHLERGTGANKVAVRIAWCGVAKAWRERYSSDYKKYAHLVNSKVTTKPDIKAFLAKHPMTLENIDDTNGPDGNTGSVLIRNAGGAGSSGVDGTGEGEAQSGVSEKGSVGTGTDVAETGEGVRHYAGPGLESELEQIACNGQANKGKSSGDIPIDPRLLEGGSQVFDETQGQTHLSGESQMPPPPPLQIHSSILSNDNTTNPGLKRKHGRPLINKESGQNEHTNVPTPGTATNDESGVGKTPKRRGRPPGSKNKKTKC